MKREEDFEIDIIKDDVYENDYDETEASDENGAEMTDRSSILYQGIEVPYVVIGMAIILLLVVFLFSSTSSTNLDRKDIKQLKALVEQLESKLIVLDNIDQKLTHIQQQGNGSNLAKNKSGRSKAAVRRNTGVIATSKKSSKRAQAAYHEVRAGDTLWIISRRYGMTVNQLCEINELDREAVLQPGQRLLVNK